MIFDLQKNMKTIILAGGFGTRLAEYTNLIPKPMVEIGGQPILWHIMNIYSSYGYNDFVIALGYKGEVIKDYFLNYYALNKKNGSMCSHFKHTYYFNWMLSSLNQNKI